MIFNYINQISVYFFKDRTQKPKDGINFSILVVPALLLAAVGIAYQLFVNRT